jgi:rare lipoprotein A
VPEVRALAIAVALAMTAVACHAGPPPKTPSARATKAATARAPRKRPRPVAPVAPATVAATERGLAVWYASGKMTASGERFDKRAMTAAHRTLPFGTRVRVTAERTGRQVVVRINDRGPFGDNRRIIDLTQAAAAKLGIIDAGVAPVTLEVLESP